MIGPEFDHTKMLQLDDLDLTLMIWRSLMDIWRKKLYFWFVLFLYFQIHTVSQSRIWPHDHLLCIIWSDFWGIRRLIRRRSAQLQDLGQIWQHSRFFVGNYTLSLLTSRAPTQHNTGSRMLYILWSLWPKPNFDQDVKWCIFITSTECFSLFNPWAVPFEGLRPWKYFSSSIIHHNIHIQSM